MTITSCIGKVESGDGVNNHDLTESFEAGTSYTPTRELAAALDLQVEWIQDSKTVKVVFAHDD
ncbi:hypothetical protein [uncultured Brevibacillus sp.]|uniref:hypothetical protein n=1 Tax=uncultured Brevibacillus sp. TaxID=169970 RepID=UPI00259A912A|nr:hypothetical protein [uncultured Brevibacillus sp.]